MCFIRCVGLPICRACFYKGFSEDVEECNRYPRSQVLEESSTYFSYILSNVVLRCLATRLQKMYDAHKEVEAKILAGNAAFSSRDFRKAIQL